VRWKNRRFNKKQGPEKAQFRPFLATSCLKWDGICPYFEQRMPQPVEMCGSIQLANWQTIKLQFASWVLLLGTYATLASRRMPSCRLVTLQVVHWKREKNHGESKVTQRNKNNP
jgi:hypothetical protein